MSQAISQFIDGLTGAFNAGDANFAEKRSEAQNVQKLQSLYRALTSGDFKAAIAAMTDDVEMEIKAPAELGFVCHARGGEQMLAALQQNFSQVEAQQPEVVSLVAQGDTVVIIAREKGRIRPTGRSYDLHWVQQYEFRNGKIARFMELTAPGAAAG